MFCPAFYESPKTPSQLVYHLVILSPTTCLFTKVNRFSQTQPPSPVDLIYSQISPPNRAVETRNVDHQKGELFLQIGHRNQHHPLRRSCISLDNLKWNWLHRQLAATNWGFRIVKPWVLYQGQWNISKSEMLYMCIQMKMMKKVFLDWMYELEGVRSLYNDECHEGKTVFHGMSRTVGFDHCSHEHGTWHVLMRFDTIQSNKENTPLHRAP